MGRVVYVLREASTEHNAKIDIWHWMVIKLYRKIENDGDNWKKKRIGNFREILESWGGK